MVSSRRNHEQVEQREVDLSFHYGLDYGLLKGEMLRDTRRARRERKAERRNT